MPSIDPRDVLPQSNLPVPSVPWGRAMQARLQGVEERVLIDKQDIDGQNRTTAAQLAAISEQLRAISEQQTILSEQQSELSDAQSDITDLLGRVVTTRVNSGSALGFPVSTSYQTRGTANIAVPSGFNRAAVVVTGWARANVGVSGTDYLRVMVGVEGDYGTVASGQGNGSTPGSGWPTATATQTSVVSDPSGALSIDLRLRSQESSWSSNINNITSISAQAIFYNE